MEELSNDEEYQDIVEDMREECGKVYHPTEASMQSKRIFVEETEASCNLTCRVAILLQEIW